MVTTFEWHDWIPGHWEQPDTPDPTPPVPPTVGTAWTVKAPMPVQLQDGASVGTIAGVLYFAGGAEVAGQGAIVRTVYAYDPAANTWTTKALLPAGRARSFGVALGGKLYVPGGADPTGSPQATLYVYDPAADTWATKAPLPATSAYHVVAAVGGLLYVIGGTGTSNGAVRVYDPAANTWTTKAAVPTNVTEAAAVAVGTKVYVLGGRPVASAGTLVQVYDTVTNTWSAGTPLPEARQRHAAALGDDGRIYLVGGQDAGGTQRATTWAYDPVAGTWDTTPPPLPSVRSNLQATNAAGLVLAIGGIPSSANSTATLVVTAGDPGDPAPEPPPPVWVPGVWIPNAARSSALLGYRVVYGRKDPSSHPDPLAATVDLAGLRAGPAPAAGARFRITADGSPRFTGEITDPKIDPTSNRLSALYAIIGTGRLGRARRRTLKLGRTWPLALDGARVARILAEAAPDLEVSVDTGTALILPPSRPVAAGQLLDLTSDSTGGQVIEQRDGLVEWHDAQHRDGAVVVLTLDASEILNDLTFEQHVGDIVNEANVSYGRAAAVVTVLDPASVDDVEAYPANVSTALVDESAAYDLGSYLVGRRSRPVWQLPDLLVDLGATVLAPKRAALLALRAGDRIALTGLPATVPDLPSELYVEGITETARSPRPGLLEWRLSIAVSDPALSGVAVRWDEVNPALTWDGVDPALTWLDLARIEDPTALEG